MNGWDQWTDPVIALTLFVQRYERNMSAAPYDATRAILLRPKVEAWRVKFHAHEAKVREWGEQAGPMPSTRDGRVDYLRRMSELGRGPRKPLEYSGMCRWCGSTDLPKGRRSYCSDECKQETVIRFVPGYARTIVGRRDRWTCQICGDKGRDCDHIVPVSEGGGCCGLDNLRILCSACHGKESGKLRKRLNAAKREIEEAAAPQLVFRLDPIADTGTA